MSTASERLSKPCPSVYRPGGPPAPPERIGGKACNLARLEAALRAVDPEAAVPAWIALTAAAREAAGPDAAVPPGLRAEILAALETAGLRHARLAVRSSAVEEDGAGASFAGQFDSVLGVEPGPDGAALWEAVRRVWVSAGNARAAAYRERRGAAEADVRMAVILQAMADASVSGVAFSADPVTGDRETAVVSAVHGLGEGLVSGELDADTFRVARAGGAPGAVRRETVRKEQAVRLTPGGGTRLEPVPEARREAPVLSDAEARRIAACARGLAEALGTPQDVEWALEGEGPARRLWVLQTRPITALPPAALPGERRLWDNSNIVESYSGVTTPLTFSFARSVYEDVYRQFCRLMGVSEPLLEAHRHVFATMLGLVRGRVYYNLLNWYRTLALLPGFSFNRAFMERMMGVSRTLENPPEPPRAAGKWEDLGRMARMAARMAGECRRLPREVPAFHARVEAVLAPLAGDDFRDRTADDLAALYRRLECELLRHWRAPLVNDFFAMLFFGVLCRLIEKWLRGPAGGEPPPPTLANDLLCGEGGIISTEPARRVMALARRVRADPALAALFASEPEDGTVWARLRAGLEHAAFHQEVRAYLDRFGDRCMNELKLETVTLGEDPAFLVRMVRAYAAGTIPEEAEARARERRIREEAEAAVRSRLRGLRRRVFMAVLAQARARVRDRENLRFERTRVFGVVRRIFLGLGQRLAAAGRLAGPRDIFYLTKEEVFACLDGTGVSTDLRALAAMRKAEFAAWEAAPAPPDRFETTGPPDGPPPEAGAAAQDPGSVLRGSGCCPGRVRAPVRVVRDPRAAGDLAGHILAAERTDPGWTLLFPAARGLLVQRGSLLSHSAIVAREMGLPCVVGVAGLMETLRDGEVVEMDGATGEILRLEPEAATRA